MPHHTRRAIVARGLAARAGWRGGGGTVPGVDAGTLAGACGAVDPCDLHEDVEGLKVAIAALSSDD